MSVVADTAVFNSADRFVEGWYWALRSNHLKKAKARAVTVLGRDLVVYRTESGRVYAMDAYCPHMGAHLAEGKIEGESLRCLFHYWKFDSQGRCTDIPCQPSTSGVPPVETWPVEEKYGLIWIWTGKRPTRPVPFVPELENKQVDAVLGNTFVKNCHPNVMMINAIDAQHFNSVHAMPVPLNLEPKVMNQNWIVFNNTTRANKESLLMRFLGLFYKGDLTYILSYWFGSTGSVTIGPDFLHFHIIFALRPTIDGKSEGQTILVTKRRTGFIGAAVNRFLLRATQIVGNYFAKGDTIIFSTIKFKLKTPLKADASIIKFIQHVEAQPTVTWGDWRRPRNDSARPMAHPETAKRESETLVLT